MGPQVFQRMVAHVLRGCRPASSPYMDDVLTGTGKRPPPLSSGKGQVRDSQAYEEASQQTPELLDMPDDEDERKACIEHHLQEARKVFLGLAKAGLTVKPAKCHLFMKQVKYIGHILSKGCRYPDPQKAAALASWKADDIKTPKALKGFLGLANWYSIYIKDYATHAAPSMDAIKGKYQYEAPDHSSKGKLDDNGKPIRRKKVKLTPKELRIEWTEDMRKGFEQPKLAMVDSCVLYLPSPESRWAIETDASDVAICGVSKQQQSDGTWQIVAYFSRKLQGSKGSKGKKQLGQLGWTHREKETYTLVCCLLKFQIWICYNEVDVCTDHSSIVQWCKEDLCTLSGPLGRRGRWHQF